MEHDWREADQRARDRQRAEHVNGTEHADRKAACALYDLDGSEPNAFKWGTANVPPVPGS